MNMPENIRSLLDKYVSNQCNPPELALMLKLFQSEEHKEQLQVMLFEYWKDRSLFCPKIEEKELSQILDSIHHQINRDQQHDPPLIRKLYRFAYRAAATLFIPLLIFSMWQMSSHSVYNEESYISLETPMGSKQKTTLPDGTEVWQNSGTTLKYPAHFSKEKREVILTGEAYFHVASDKNHPFLVKTQEGTVKVTGTKFNVSSYPDDSKYSVVLEEGKVSFEAVNHKTPIEMLPSEQIVMNKKTGTILKQKTDTEKYTSWISGKLIFRNDQLSDVVTRLGRWYNVDIILNDPNGTIGQHPLTMTIKNETIQQVLDYITQAAELKLQKEHIGQGTNGSIARTKYVISRIN